MFKRRLQINPGPLRLRGRIPKPDYDANRCQAIIRSGRRCLRDGVRTVDGRWLCNQHAELGEEPRRWARHA